MSVSESTAERVNLEYQGSTLRTALWLLVTGVISIPIVTAAWAAAFLYRRILPQISFSDGTRATFQGLAGRVWGWFVIGAVLSAIPTVVGGIVYNGDPLSLILLSQDIDSAVEAGGSTVDAAYLNAASTAGILGIVVAFVAIYVQLVIMRWAIAGIELTDGAELYFSGQYLRLLGWLLLYVVSFITIVGWAWVVSAFLRWFARNIEGAGIRFEFVGSGWGVLWRLMGIGVVAVVLGMAANLIPVLAILVLVWYLWALIWLLRWLIRNVVLVRAATSPGTPAPEM